MPNCRESIIQRSYWRIILYRSRLPYALVEIDWLGQKIKVTIIEIEQGDNILGMKLIRLGRTILDPIEDVLEIVKR